MSEPACRQCRSPLDQVFLDLGMSPLSNAYLGAEQLHEMEPFYPLRVMVCDECLLVQLPEVARAETIFDADYAYFSSYSTSWLEHCEAYAKKMIDERALGAQSSVVEIASNDGYLLQYFKQAGVPVLGVEPAGSVANVARTERGIPTVEAFFGRATAERLLADGERADLIVANNVFAHVPDVHDLLGGVKLLLKEHGVCTFEFPHLMALIDGNQFDTIYHEHYSYFSFLSAQRAFASEGLEVFDVEELATHGGSLRVYASHPESAPERSARLADFVAREAAAGLHSLDGYSSFKPRVDALKRDLLEHLIAARRAGEHVAAYGAPAKGNTLLNYCGARQDLIEYTVDRNPHKQGRFLPGTHIPIYAPERLAETKPTLIVILPWNLRDELLEQLAYAREWGARFLFPIPAPEIVE